MTLFYILVTLLLANMKELNSKRAFLCIQAKDNLHIKLGNDSQGYFPLLLHPLLLQGAFKQIYSLMGDINISYLNMSFANAIPKTVLSETTWKFLPLKDLMNLPFFGMLNSEKAYYIFIAGTEDFL